MVNRIADLSARRLAAFASLTTVADIEEACKETGVDPFVVRLSEMRFLDWAARDLMIMEARAIIAEQEGN